MSACAHRPHARAPARTDACEACGAREQLRVCDHCGHVGCADSHGAHASAHARAAAHPVLREHGGAGGAWTWCDACADYVA